MTVISVHAPSHREALWELESAFERGDLITVFGRCTVSYAGRAASELGVGDRLLILKPDGAALVHTDEGRTPVNWQPPGSTHHAAVREGRLRVRSKRTNPAETLLVRFERVHQLSAMSVTGGRDLELHGSEEDLRTRVLERPELIAPGFEPVSTERETAAGPVDVFGVDDAGDPVVVELKRRRVGPDAVGQLARYVAAVRDELTGDGEFLADHEAATADDSVRGVLVAPSLTDRAADLLADRGFDHVALGPPADAGESVDALADDSDDSDDLDDSNTTAGSGSRPDESA
ncbi:endonuclease NucS [Halorubrum vacuolatum]|uniref:Endonuclease NucS n=1 Tax=Halorubrum vacuolatum TaxID=63740 RepID=A0A238WR13_HALVU|nr:endonuclease NucS [Halorubrum vacuolatum]SNR48848.1 hypothetical protein SAMN06264855_10984 [Halorubrum vacuolatum]